MLGPGAASDADQAMAEDRRLLGELFTLATASGPHGSCGPTGSPARWPSATAALAERVRRRAGGAAALVSALWEALGRFVFALGLVAAIIALVLRAAHGHVRPGPVVMAVTLMRRAQTRTSRSTDTAGSFATSVAAARELLWLEDRARALAARQGRLGSRCRRRWRTGILIQGLEFTYPGRRADARTAVDLELPAGSTVALVGENGAGKTTLVKLLTRMYAPGAGRSAWTDRSRRTSKRPVAGTESPPRSRTSCDSSFGGQSRHRRPPPARRPDRSSGRPRASRLGSARERLPEGLATRSAPFNGGRELSGGQWQNLALARG